MARFLAKARTFWESHRLSKKTPKPSGEVFESEPVTEIPTQRKAKISGFGQPLNLATYMDADRIQSALRMAERGETWQYFTLLRDMSLNYSHLIAEWNKRKAVVVGQPQALIPRIKDNPDDKIAAQVIEEMIDNCSTWMDSLDHLLDATLYPVSVAEKIFKPVPSYQNFRNPIRFTLESIFPVSYTLLCFKVPYAPNNSNSNPATKWDVNTWEPNLRFYQTDSNGYPIYNISDVYAPDPNRHIVHRGNMLNKSIPDNYGGPIRATLFWWLLATKDRDWWGVMMQKYGSPFIMGKTNTQSIDHVNFLQSAFSLANQIGGLVIDKKDEAELVQMAATDGSNAHKIFQEYCNSEVSKIILGQTLSSTPEKTGLGSSMGKLHGEVREDIRRYDTRKLRETLERQLFLPYLRINGYKGNPPIILWGGEREHELLQISQSVNQLYAGGLEPTDEGIESLSKKVGVELKRRVMPTDVKPEPNLS